MHRERKITKKGEKVKFTRANVSTRNKCLPLDLTNWDCEKDLVVEAEDEKYGSKIEVWIWSEDDDGAILEIPNSLNPDNCRICLQIAAIE